MTTSIKKEIMKALDEQLNDLFNLAGLTLTAFIRKDINQDERDAILGEFNELGLDQIEAALTRIEQKTRDKFFEELCGMEVDPDEQETLSDFLSYALDIKLGVRPFVSPSEEKECKCICHKEGKDNYHNVGDVRVDCHCSPKKEKRGR